ncbi:MAG: hypothetical protein AB8C95_11000, partial [Phycisphaeraceae bacterium]
MMIKRSVLSLLCVLSFSATAQEVNTNANEQLADSYVRSALSFLTFSEAIKTDEPAVLAGTLLDSAIQLDPANAQAWSMRSELAESSGDFDAYEEALVGYLGTGVDDDRARFSLIRYRLSKSNTLDAQLREVEQLLNSEMGRSFSGPLRSRLASFASATGNELGDERARRKWAVEAARADPANLEAAQAMLGLVIELGGDAVKRGTATVNVVRADPVSPVARLQLAAQLAEQGAFVRAAQQYEVVSTRLSPEALPMDAYVQWAHCLAMSGQDELLLQLLNDFEAALNQAPPAPAAPEGEDAAADAEQPKQEKVDLPITLDVVRLAILRDGDDQDQAQIVFDRIARQLEADGDDEELNQQAKKNLVSIAAVFGPNLDQAQSIAEANDNDPVALAWIALRRGDTAKAREQFKAHAAKQPIAACGLAIATGQDDAGRARLMQAFIESSSTTSLAALTAGREMLKTGTPPQPTTAGKALLALMAKYSESFWRVDIERTPWVDVRMRITPQRIKPLQPIKAEITIWNTSRFPLAITEDGPIKQNALVTINATSAGRMLPPTPPIVVDLGRRFSLKAGERMIIDTRLDYHQFGTLRDRNPGAPISFDARLLTNPALNQAGLWRPAGIGGLSDIRDCLVEARPTNAKAIDAWLADLNSEVVSTRLNVIKRLAALNRLAQPDLIDPATVQRVTTPLLQVWDNGTEVEQAWIIANAVALSDDNTTYPALLE